VEAEGALRRRTLAVALVGVCAFLDLYATQPLLPLFRQIFHASATQVSLTLSATTLAVALMAPIVGLVADRVGRNPVILACLLGLSAATLLASTSPGLNALIGWRFVQGLFMPGLFAVTMAYIHEEQAGQNAGAVMGAYIAGSILGGSGGRILTGLITEYFGWRQAFVVLGIVNLGGALAVRYGLPRSQRFVPETNLGASLRAMAAHLRNPLLLVTYAVGFNILFCLVATFTYINFYLAAPPFRLGTAALSSLFLVYLSGVIVTPFAGRWITRIGCRRPVLIGFLVSGMGILLTLGHVLLQEVIGLMLCACGIFLCQAAATSYIGVAADRARSSASGLYVTFYYIGGSVGGLLPGLFWAWRGWPACVGLVVAVQFLTAAMAWRFWRE
jgi:YNFM family putative membrane transporter